jgi:hypothetical protein
MRLTFLTKAIGAAVVLATLNMSGANAALVLTGGTEGTIPGGEANEVIPALFPGETEVEGYYGAQVLIIGGSDNLTFDLLGWEAGYTNEFLYNGDSLPDPFNSPGPMSVSSLETPLKTFSTNVIATTASDEGLVLDFSFLVLGVQLTNAINPDDSNPIQPVGVNFFVSQLTPKSILLWLDDGGAGPDDDHDDLVVRITQTPLPLSLPLFLSGLGLLGFLARQRRRQSA